MPIFPAFPGFTFGADPELFLFDTKKREYVGAEDYLPGTKEAPYKVNRGAVQVDGMAAEFNIDPASTFEEFTTNIQSVLGTLQSMLPPTIELQAKPAVLFNQKTWAKASEKAKELGCSPDFNAWTGEVNPPPGSDGAVAPSLRTASGHLHIGWTSDKQMDDTTHTAHCRDLVKQLDFFLGPWSVLYDKDPTRRALYGKAGAMRYKPYGVEYRVLSNFWVLEPNLHVGVWNRMNAAIYAMKNNFFPEMASAMVTTLQRSINEGDTQRADLVLSNYKTLQDRNLGIFIPTKD